jgi:hypothetical protein
MVITVIDQGDEDPRVTIMEAIASPQFGCFEQCGYYDQFQWRWSDHRNIW